jgi:hypothetical protein
MTRRHERRPEVTHYDASGQPKNTATAAAANVYTLYVADTAQTQTFTDADAALLAASSGDVLRLPSGTIAGDHTLVAGLEVIGSRNTVLTGVWTGAAGAQLTNVHIAISADDAGLVYGVYGPTSGILYVEGCTVEVKNATGDATALYSNTAGTIKAKNCRLSGIGARGYCFFKGATGTAGDLDNCVLAYSTSPVGGA